MRKVSIVLAFLFALIGIAFAILPMGTIGLLPVGLSLVFGIIAFAKSTPENRNVPKWLLIVAGLIAVVVIGKSFIPDEVNQDTEFEQRKIEAKAEDMKDLEELEGLE